MFLKLRKRTINFANILSSSIAFYPTLISLGLFILAIYLVNAEFKSSTDWLKENVPFLAIASADAARTILATIIGGIISLTVFSFSMVMMTLNQASTNFSPRILPGLVSEKNNQIVLGFYLGTTIFSLIILLSIKPNNDISSLSVMSVLISIILFILCLGLFIYFINHISQGIQIDNIMNMIYKDTLHDVEAIIEADSKTTCPSVLPKRSSIVCQKGNFYHGALKKQLLKVCKEYNTNVYIDLYKGQFVQKGAAICYYSVSKNEEIEKKILSALNLNGDHRMADTYKDGFSQLTEIGLKAMSPGINDPATALITLDYLSNLFLGRVRMFDFDSYYSDDKEYVFMENRLLFSELLKNCISQYRLYCRGNMVLMCKIKDLLTSLSTAEHKEKHYKADILLQIEALDLDAKAHISNTKDLANFVSR